MNLLAAGLLIAGGVMFAGRRTVDGLEMLLRQAVPSFEAFFGATPPAEVDVRALALAQLGDAAR